MSVCKTGLNKLHRVVEMANDDIARRLWTLYWLVRMTQAKTVVELGVRKGDSTRALLCACEDTGAKLVSIDCENAGPVVVNETARLGIGWPQAEWEFILGDSVIEGMAWKRGPVEMVFVDTDHTYETTHKELQVWTPHVYTGGCMAFHDYWLPDKPRDGVKPAVDQFVDALPNSWTLETHDVWNDTGFAIIWRK